MRDLNSIITINAKTPEDAQRQLSELNCRNRQDLKLSEKLRHCLPLSEPTDLGQPHAGFWYTRDWIDADFRSEIDG